MFPLLNRILLWSGNTTMLMNDAMKLKEVNHLKLKPIVYPKDLNRLTKLSFNHGIKGL